MELDKEVTKLLDAGYRYLGYRARTKKEMTDYLTRKAEQYNVSETAVKQTINYLEENNYINDSSFIDLYVSSRSNLKPKSTYALSLELMQKGVARNLIEVYFQENVLNEKALAIRALKRKWSSLKRFNKETRFKKASDFLRRRGFPYSIVKKTIEEFEFEE